VSEGLPGELPAEWSDLGHADEAALAPPAGAKERVRGRVALTLGLGAGFLAATAASSTATAASSTTAAAGIAGAGAAGGAGGGGTGVAATGIAGTLLAKKALLVGVAAAVSVGGGTAAYLEVRSERARTPIVTPAPARAPVARPVAPPAPEPLPAEAPADTLGDERGLLDRARQDIAQGLLAEAGVLLDRHAAQFPAGQLSEEREALVIRLLLREGREREARARAARFRKQHPRSIQLPGIDDALRERR
jgi:hypothetical protein